MAIELKDTESAHKEAMLELARMKETMDTMEQERAEMVAEVEAQIERALASMAVDIDESDYGSSRPSSRLSSASAPSRSRRVSDAAKTHHLRSFGTESTLAEAYDEHDREFPHGSKSDMTTGTIEEDDEEDLPSTPSRKKRFSASEVDAPQDGMNAVDEGISRKSEKIAQKVLQIEHKVSLACSIKSYLFTLQHYHEQLENALASDRRRNRWKDYSTGDSEEDPSEAAPVRTRSSKGQRLAIKTHTKNRKRSGTASSTQTGTSVHTDEGTVSTVTHARARLVSQGNKTPTRGSFSADEENPSATQGSPPESSLKTARSPPLGKTKALATVAGTTDDSDTDFQSAYSTSPRRSHGSFEAGQEPDEDLSDFGKQSASKVARERVSSTATAIHSRVHTTSTSTIV
jgi:EEF1A N-terminal glycine/lysine methyltransferase